MSVENPVHSNESVDDVFFGIDLSKALASFLAAGKQGEKPVQQEPTTIDLPVGRRNETVDEVFD